MNKRIGAAARSRKGDYCWIGTPLSSPSSSGRFQEVADESEKGFGKPALRLEIDTLVVSLESSSRAAEARSWKWWTMIKQTQGDKSDTGTLDFSSPHSCEIFYK